MRILTVTKLVFAALLALSFSTVCLADSINWQPYSSAAFAKAKKSNKMVLLFGKANWCPWCRRMKNETYSDDSIIKLVNSNFIPVMIDIDDDASIADRFDISVVPVNIILTGDYKVVDSKTGYLSVSQLTSFLKNTN